MALYKTYTILESKQIMDVLHIIKDKHKKTDISHLRTISDDILYTVYHDDRVRSVYDKKKITIGTLHYLLIKHNNNKYMKHHIKLIKDHEPHIDTIIRKYNNAKKEKSRCSESCVIL